MKKILLASTLIALSSLSFADVSGTLLMKGVVQTKISLEVTAAPSATALDLKTSKTNLVVASVNEKSNSKTGYKVTITSANNSKLLRGDGGTEFFAYSMSYNGSTVDLSTSSGATIVNSSITPANATKNVAISYTGISDELMVEGTYSDTVTFSIAAN